jgi:hypothetical protein
MLYEKAYDDDETYRPHFLKSFLTALKASQIAEPEFSKTLKNLTIVSIILQDEQRQQQN